MGVCVGAWVCGCTFHCVCMITMKDDGTLVITGCWIMILRPHTHEHTHSYMFTPKVCVLYSILGGEWRVEGAVESVRSEGVSSNGYLLMPVWKCNVSECKCNVCVL